MASEKLAAPGTEHGPCVDACEHTDCAATRAMATSDCGLCFTPIGYDTSLYDTPEHGLVHADCYEDYTERLRNQPPTRFAGMHTVFANLLNGKWAVYFGALTDADMLLISPLPDGFAAIHWLTKEGDSVRLKRMQAADFPALEIADAEGVAIRNAQAHKGLYSVNALAICRLVYPWGK
jgi:hypothetical protein